MKVLELVLLNLLNEIVIISLTKLTKDYINMRKQKSHRCGKFNLTSKRKRYKNVHSLQILREL